MNTVAIVTRTKDRPVFLRRAIQSVANQAYRDYVHVIVNDGGNVGDIESVINNLDAATSKHVKLFHRDTSSNAPDTIFNESIDRIDSEYFTIHDDDDTWHPEFLEKTIAHLDEHKDLAAVVTRTDRIDEVVVDGAIKHKKTSQWMSDVKVINLYRQCIDNQFTPIATVFRRSAYVAVGKFDETLPVVGDWEFGIRLLSKYDADFIDPGYALANYHHRKKNGTAQDAVSGHNKHRYYTNLVMNKYLRQELSEGRLGVGYVMSQLKYNQSAMAAMAKRFLPTGVVEKLKKHARG